MSRRSLTQAEAKRGQVRLSPGGAMGGATEWIGGRDDYLAKTFSR